MSTPRLPPDLPALCTRFLRGHGTDFDLALLGRKRVELKVEATRLFMAAGLDQKVLQKEMHKLDAMIEAELFGAATKPECQRIDYTGGNTYVGEIKDGVPHGHGHIFYSDGAHHKGLFVNNIPEGRGVFTDEYGGRQEGAFRDGKLNGKGRAFHVNGDTFEGEFQNGEMVGLGRMVNKDLMIEGNFTDWLVQGVGRQVQGDGGIFEGVFKDTQPIDGVFINANGTRRRVRMKNGELHEVKTKKRKSRGKLHPQRSRKRRFLRNFVLPTAMVVGLLAGYLAVVGRLDDVISVVASATPIFYKHGPAAVAAAAEELSSLPSSAVHRVTSVPPPSSAYNASSLGPDVAAATSKIFEQIADSCGANLGTILQTTVAETSRGTYADAAYCCQGEEICRPPRPDIEPVIVRASIWMVRRGGRSDARFDDQGNLKPGLTPWEVYKSPDDANRGSLTSSDDLDWLSINGFRTTTNGLLEEACARPVYDARKEVEIMRVSESLGLISKVEGRGVDFFTSEFIFDILCNKQQLDHYGIPY